MAVVFYSYAGYGMLLYLLIKCRALLSSSPAPPGGNVSFQWPSIAFVIAALDEEDVIENKIGNTLLLDYPAQKLNIIIITDGSTDRTPQIVGKYAGIRLLHQSQRAGKTAAMNRAIRFVHEEITVFSDANTMLNKDCLKQMAKHYADPKVGGVAGEKKVTAPAGIQTAAGVEGLYWRYESLLKKLDSDFYSVVGAAGELFSVRTSLYEPVKEGTIIEDFVLSLQICLKHYVIRYEPGAFSIETASISMKEEQKRKVRIAAGAFQAMVMLKPLFNVLRYPVLSFQFLSHRILRWTLCPICLVLASVSDMLLTLTGGGGFYAYVCLFQVIFYGMAISGWLLAHFNVKVRALYVPYYFLFMNVAVFQGFYRFIRNKQTVLWEKPGRQINR